MNFKKEITICYSCNNEYLNYLKTSIYSLNKSNSDTKLNIYVLHKNITEINMISILNKFVSDSVKINFIQVQHNFGLKLKKINRFPEETLFRLLIPKLIKEDKVLFLDVDTIILKDLNDLFNLNIDAFPFAALIDIASSESIEERKNRLNMRAHQHYFNTGVLLINNRFLKKEPLFDEAINFAISNAKKLVFPDQDSLSAVTDNFYELSPKYHFLATLNKRLYFKFKPVIIHYIGNKPLQCRIKVNYTILFYKFYWKAIDKNIPINFLFSYICVIKQIINTFLSKLKAKLIVIFKNDKVNW